MQRRKDSCNADGPLSTNSRSSALRWAAALLCLVVSVHYAFIVLPPAAAQHGPGIWPDLYPVWFATRAVLVDGRDPYRLDVTREIQTAMYQGKLVGNNEQRFAYPPFVILLFAPFGALPFNAAQALFFALAAMLTGLSVVAWLGRSALPMPLLGCILVIASFPVMLGLELRQPTMLIAALLAAMLACLRSRQMVTAGLLGAIASAKPQLAIGVLLPVIVWAFAGWFKRKSFLFSLCLSLGTLLLISECLVHGWLREWLQTIRAYAGYAGAKPLVRILPGVYPPIIAAVLLIAASLAVSWKWTGADLPLAVGFSVSVFLVLIPFQFYNEVILLPGVLWSVVHTPDSTRKLQVLLRCCVLGILATEWVAMAMICVAHVTNSAIAAKLWDFPLMFAWMFPFALLAYLASCASAQTPAAYLESSVLLRTPAKEAPRA